MNIFKRYLKLDDGATFFSLSECQMSNFKYQAPVGAVLIAFGKRIAGFEALGIEGERNG